RGDERSRSPGRSGCRRKTRSCASWGRRRGRARNGAWPTCFASPSRSAGFLPFLLRASRLERVTRTRVVTRGLRLASRLLPSNTYSTVRLLTVRLRPRRFKYLVFLDISMLAFRLHSQLTVRNPREERPSHEHATAHRWARRR